MTAGKASSADSSGPPGSVDPGASPAARSPDGRQPDSSRALAFALALQQAKTCLGGLAALAHWREPADGRLRLVASDEVTPAVAEAWAQLRGEQDTAPARAVRRGGYVWVDGDALGIGASGTAAVPLLGADGPVGVLSVLTGAAGEPDETQRSFLRAIAAWAAARVHGVPQPSAPGPVAMAERSILMGELTAALAEAVTAQDVVQAVADYVMPPFGADGLLVQVLNEDERLYAVGSAGYPEEFTRLMDGFPLSDYATVHDVARTRTPRFIESKAEYNRLYPSMSQVSVHSPKEAWAFLPMIASGRTIGLCTVSFSEPRPFSDEERTLLTALSGLVGQALERARLYDMEHARARELQRGLLPSALPRLPAVRAAARYLPAAQGEEVGGDWYDVIPLSADRVAIVIGDVMGHGIAEAATMGRLRTAVSTLADLDMAPDELFDRLNDLVSDLGEDFYATCLYAVFDPVARTCSYALAGHPRPVVVHCDGTVHSPVVAADPPLGAAHPPFETHQLQLPGESLLVLCTDGLIESPTQDVDQGLDRLQQVLTQAAADTAYFQVADEEDDVRQLEELCDTVVSALLPEDRQTNDDVGLLIVHTRCTDPRDVAGCDLPQDPRAAGQARQYIRAQLTAWGLADHVLTTELLVSELVGNVVRHASGPVRLRLLRSRSLICEVYDGSLNTPRIRHADYTDEGGRGLQLVAALSRRWGARYLQGGKCIWTEQDLSKTDQQLPNAELEGAGPAAPHAA
ncbi:Serine phosphatase RsbU, regulator of sigma subunit [Streptomyces sp. DvalAA-14]|uniref:ATP-binding SpoIIE family protein phosphatase n=1 Tax=unclassified Streptomyces TaxID=2593676 RepID=UPI00081B1601|nr:MULTISPECIES: SpoIIE family protein phosphatase [unclassified Streptomyces]MYS23634.1 SpoIIE family protein phosphatase [Streptomyces sp. SID4948]SCE36474.1 Serine phosphatase RsbU, regulator of sigma subunit [Streptomyces sp. DvalAA-14]